MRGPSVLIFGCRLPSCCSICHVSHVHTFLSLKVEVEFAFSTIFTSCLLKLTRVQVVCAVVIIPTLPTFVLLQLVTVSVRYEVEAVAVCAVAGVCLCGARNGR